MADAPKSCEEVLELLYPYIDGEVAGLLCAEIQSHLELCLDCFKRYDLERDIKAIVSRKCGEPIPDEIRDRLRSRLREALGKD